MTTDVIVASNGGVLSHVESRADQGRILPGPDDQGEPQVRRPEESAESCETRATTGACRSRRGSRRTALLVTERRLAAGLDPADDRKPARRYGDWKRAAVLFARGHTPAEVAGALGVPLRKVRRNLRRSRRLQRWIDEARVGLIAARGGRKRFDWKLAARLMAYDYSETEIADRLGCTVRHVRRRMRESANFYRWLDEESRRRARREVRMMRLLRGEPAAKVRDEVPIYS